MMAFWTIIRDYAALCFAYFGGSRSKTSEATTTDLSLRQNKDKHKHKKTNKQEQQIESDPSFLSKGGAEDSVPRPSALDRAPQLNSVFQKSHGQNGL